ncbi:MAG: hypothetical protein EON92_12350 [Burkholderiales bacterium]|nr:MAG: hypothetical protein EON92_12350 [Burkholderiales bacterium]
MKNHSSLATRRAALVAAFGTAFLSACGGGGSSEDPPAPPPPSPPPPPPPSPAPSAVVAPTITRSPASTTVIAGATASFDVETGGGPVTAYQWLREGMDVAGATAPSYSLAPVSLLESGKSYAVRVGNSAGSTTSETAMLTVTSLPVTLVAGIRDLVGDEDGAATVARFNAIGDASMVPIAADDEGNVYLASYAPAPGSGSVTLIRKVAVDGTVTILAGVRGDSGFLDGTGSAARFRYIVAMFYDRARKLLVVVDTVWDVPTPNFYLVREVTLGGKVTTVGGFMRAEQLKAPASFNGNIRMAMAPDGTIYFAGGNVVQAGGFGNTYLPTAVFKIPPGGAAAVMAGDIGLQGSVDGVGGNARFHRIEALAADSAGNVFAAEYGRLRKIAPDGTVTTLVGSLAEPVLGTPDRFADGQGPAAALSTLPSALAVEASGSVLAYDDRYLRRITAGGSVVTLADLGAFSRGRLALDAAGKAYFTSRGWVGRVDGLMTPV